MVVVKFNNVEKSFGNQTVFKGLNLNIEENTITVITGPSGCGKSTILNLIGLLEKADSGKILLFGQPAPKPFSAAAIDILRNKIGYLFQNFALVDNKTVAYNLKIALEHVNINKHQAIAQALQQVGLSGFENKLIYQCSGGEQQRIAIARVMLKPCELVLCDEPTGSLDKKNKKIVIELLRKLKLMGKTIIIVTHDSDLMDIADKHISLVS